MGWGASGACCLGAAVSSPNGYNGFAMNRTAMGSGWVGRTVDGRYPLLQWLGGTESSGVFLTKTGEPGEQKAAIRLMAAENADSADCMAGWRAGAALSHPHLLRVLATGECRMGEAAVLYCVTEYGDEVLGEVIRERTLSPDEVRKMLRPLLDALEYVHAQGLVLGRVRPSNIMAVNDCLKLSCGSLRRAGTVGASEPDLFDAPEVAAGTITPAADVWSLGVTLVESLTQQAPERGTAGDPAIPGGLPEPFASITRECLRRDPKERCTLSRVRELLAGNAKAGTELESPPAPAAEKTGSRKSAWVAVLVLLALAAATAVWLYLRQPEAPVAVEHTAAPAAGLVAGQSSAGHSGKRARSSAEPVMKGAVISRVMPDVPEDAMQTIDGTVLFSVRVGVNADGTVNSASIDRAGTSPYFHKFALAAARQWRFAPAHSGGQAVRSTWVLHFALRRSGIEVRPEEVAP